MFSAWVLIRERHLQIYNTPEWLVPYETRHTKITYATNYFVSISEHHR